MVYQQCGPSCPQTCDANEDTDCNGGCVEGCFCPSEQVLAYGKCVDAIDCLGKLPVLCVTSVSNIDKPTVFLALMRTIPIVGEKIFIQLLMS